MKGGGAQGEPIVGMDVGTGCQQDAGHFGVVHERNDGHGIIIGGMDVGTGSQQQADDFGMTLGGGLAQGRVIVGMGVDVGGQCGLDTIDVAQAGRFNQGFFWRGHAVILAATAKIVQSTWRWRRSRPSSTADGALLFGGDVEGA